MMRIAIIGVGAMGCLFAARLAPFADVTMVGHWAPQLDALRRGLTLVTPEGRELRRRVFVTDDANSLRTVAIALVLVKSYQTARSAREIRTLLEPEGIAITLQNGISNEQALASQLGDGRVVVGTTTEGATLLDAGVVRHAGYGVTILPLSADNRAGLIDSFAGVLGQAGFKVELSKEAEARVWEKLAVNAAINPLTALMDAPNRLLIDNPAAHRLSRLAAEEASLVARAVGHDVDPENAVSRAMAVATATGENISSMLQDVRSGRPTELEAITGSVIREGRKRGVPTPANTALRQLLTVKLRGEDWKAAISTLPANLQPLFRGLTQEGTDENL